MWHPRLVLKRGGADNVIRDYCLVRILGLVDIKFVKLDAYYLFLLVKMKMKMTILNPKSIFYCLCEFRIRK